MIGAFENNNFNEQTHDANIFNETNMTESYCIISSECYPGDRKNNDYGTSGWF